MPSGGERCCVNLWVFGVGSPAAAAALTEINYKYWTAAGMYVRSLTKKHFSQQEGNY